MEYKADGYLSEYMMHRVTPVAIAAQDPVECRGLVLSHRCTECGGTQPTTDSGYEVKSPTGVLCMDCEHPWEYQEEARFTGEIRTAPEKGSTEKRYYRAVDLGRQFDRIREDAKMLWCFRYYAASCSGWSMRQLVEEGPEAWGEEAPTTVYAVRKLILAGRAEWVRRLHTIGIKC